MDFELFQQQHRAWVRHNFPNQTREQAFLGVVEEVGEMAHDILKAAQGIREYADMEEDERELLLRHKLADSIGDLVIFTEGLAMMYGLDFAACVQETWAEVRKRDWVKYPDSAGLAPPTG